MTPYACNNTPRAPGYWAMDGKVSHPSMLSYGSVMVFKAVHITDTLSKDCQYRKEVTSDPRCEGCEK